MKKHIFSCLSISVFCLFTFASAQTTHYVKTIATGDASGSSWNNASGDLQLMINSSVPGDVVWVAGGTYKPIYRADNLSVLTPNDRNNAFVLKPDVKIYGGFAGNEMALTQRDSTRITNNTILSGDLGVIDDNSDNAYHVVISAGSVGSAGLNGFTIKDGNANGPGGNLTVLSQSIYSYEGGGLELTNSSPVLTNITVSANNAISIGGGINNYNSSPVLFYVNIIGNIAGSGGGIYNNSSSPAISNTIISGNSAIAGGGAGGGIYNLSNSFPVLTNVTISGNTASYGGGILNNNGSLSFLTNVTISGNLAISGGAIYNNLSSPKIRNSIIYDNSTGILNAGGSMPAITYSLVQDLTDESNGNISGSKDPLFVAPLAPGLSTGGDYRLKSTASPAYNSGNNAYFDAGQTPDLSAITTDLDGNPRIIAVIELGAYEFNSFPLPVTIVNYSAQAEGSRTKLKWTTATESNNKEFIVSRSADGKNYTEIGRVAGAGNSSLQNNYVYNDENPVDGINFYRLEQMDFDGRKTDVGVRMVNYTSVVNNVIKIYPNPVMNSFRIEFAANTYQVLVLTNANGKQIQRLHLSTIDTFKDVMMRNLTAGTYFIQLIGNDKIESRKVVKE